MNVSPNRDALILLIGLLIVFAIAGVAHYSSGRTSGGGNTTTVTTVSLQRAVAPGTRISNFLLQQVNSNSTVYGRLYILYPVAYVNGTPVTLKIGDTIGYSCDATEWRLTAVNWYNSTATFTYVPTGKGPCPL